MKYAFFSLSLALTACDRDRPPVPDSDQQAQLDDAEAMLNDMAENEEGAVSANSAAQADAY